MSAHTCEKDCDSSKAPANIAMQNTAAAAKEAPRLRCTFLRRDMELCGVRTIKTDDPTGFPRCVTHRGKPGYGKCACGERYSLKSKEGMCRKCVKRELPLRAEEAMRERVRRELEAEMKAKADAANVEPQKVAKVAKAVASAASKLE